MKGPVPRHLAMTEIAQSFRAHPVVAVVGPRQCGKTTLAKIFTQTDSETTYFDLESYIDRRRLESPISTLLELSGTVVIDEVQRVPELFETLRVVVDSDKCRSRFLLLCSVSPSLIKGVSETLAGRIGIVQLGGFTIDEIPKMPWRSLWNRGGFPRSILAEDETVSVNWRRNFVTTFLERDIPQYGVSIPSETLRRFWTMIAHYHGQIWNGAEFARALGVNEPAARRYLDILSSSFMVRVLVPWYENLKKRQLKSPKIYIRDAGILHSLLELDSFDDLSGHVKIGASFEGFAIENLIHQLQLKSCYFWGTHAGAELDLMTTIRGKRYGFEIKYSDAPRTTRSMRTAISDLQLQHLWIVYPGAEYYRLDDAISVVSIEKIDNLVNQIKLTDSSTV